MGTLYLVATPIGNLEDVTLRALRVLGEADLVFAEDTRRTRTLLERHAVNARPRSLHAHNEAARVGEALAALGAGRDVALVSDAGTPLVSDPGGRLVVAVLEEGHRVESVPGASAVLAALTASGFETVPFAFLGFVPRRAGARTALLETWRGRPETLLFFESPRRVGPTLEALAALLGPRRACVARELTKRHEEIVRGTLPELAERFSEGARGEVTLVVEGDRSEPEAIDVEARIREGVEAGQSPREIAAALAPLAGVPKREIYARAVALREEA